MRIYSNYHVAMDTDEISSDTFLHKCIHIHYIDDLDELPVHYLKKNLNPPMFDIENFMTSSFYDVTPCLSPLITQIGQFFYFHSIINNVFHCKRLNIMHGLLDYCLFVPFEGFFSGK